MIKWTYQNKIKFLIVYYNLARVSDLNVTRTKLPWKQIPPHTIVEITQPPGSFHQSRHKDAYEKYPGTRWENHQTYQESKTRGRTGEGDQEDDDENDRECRAG